MVKITLDRHSRQLILDATVITYGHAATPELTQQIAEEIENMWNEPGGRVILDQIPFAVTFRIGRQWIPDLTPEMVILNTDPSNNYYRIEAFAYGNISFVDGLGSNTGYFKLENLYAGSTTAAHEFGHGLGLDHPPDIDIRGKGRPGIMYPRGTWVDPAFQYDATAAPGAPGGTMHPMHRRVLPGDIAALQLENHVSGRGLTVLGKFSSVFHADHTTRNLG